MSRMVKSRALGAALRASLVALIVALPQLLLGQGSGGAAQVVVLVALLAWLYTFSEYAAEAPSVLEFRDARPYNRLRLGTLLVAVVIACAMLRPDWSHAPAAQPVRWLGETWAWLLELPWSPVHHLLSTLPPGTDPQIVQNLFAAAAAAYGLSLLMVLAFALVIRFHRWPGHSSFNVWVNLPQFDPTAGGDVVQRLHQNALVNVSLGFLLPLIVPIVADVLRVAFDGPYLRDQAALVWVVVAWAFIPASLAMRGLALHRLAQMIAAHRARLQRASGLPLAA
jgi:hypothetical protein